MKAEHPQVRARIDQLGLRYDKVAAKVGLTPDRFAHILDGRRPVPEPSDDFYAHLAEALFCEPGDIRESEEEAAAA